MPGVSLCIHHIPLVALQLQLRIYNCLNTDKTKNIQIKLLHLLNSAFSVATEDIRHATVNVDGKARICFAKQFNNIICFIFIL